MTMMSAINVATSSPQPPGAVLRDTLGAMGITQSELARAIDVSRPRLNMILTGRCQLSAEIALRLGRVLNTSPVYRTQACEEWELFQATQRLGAKLAALPTLAKRNPFYLVQ